MLENVVLDKRDVTGRAMVAVARLAPKGFLEDRAKYARCLRAAHSVMHASKE